MTRLEARLLWLAGLSVVVTGSVLGWMKYLLEPSDPYAVVNHPHQPTFLHLHVVAAPVLVFALGALLSSHILTRIRTRTTRGRRSGLLMAAAIVPMVMSGYAIQVLTTPSWLRAVVVVHVVSSLLFTLGLAGHLALAWRRSANAAKEHPTAGAIIGLEADSGS